MEETTSSQRESHLPWAAAEGGQSGLEMHEESQGLVALGRELKEQPPGSLCWVIPHTAEAIFLRQNTALQAWGEAIAPPAGIPLALPWSLSQTDEYSWRLFQSLSLTAKEDPWELWNFSWPSPKPGVVKSWPGCIAWFFLHTARHSRGSYKLWIADNSKQVAHGQSRAVSDLSLHQNLCRST